MNYFFQSKKIFGFMIGLVVLGGGFGYLTMANSIPTKNQISKTVWADPETKSNVKDLALQIKFVSKFPFLSTNKNKFPQEQTFPWKDYYDHITVNQYLTWKFPDWTKNYQISPTILKKQLMLKTKITYSPNYWSVQHHMRKSWTKEMLNSLQITPEMTHQSPEMITKLLNLIKNEHIPWIQVIGFIKSHWSKKIAAKIIETLTKHLWESEWKSSSLLSSFV